MEANDDPLKKELCAFAFSADRSRLNRCLAPGMSCGQTAVRAHSVQNSRALELLARQNHVKGIIPRVGPSGPALMFSDIGRNHATTFEGFCAEHDSDIFRPIDQRPITATDDEQLFLLAYRAVARELHGAMEAAIKLQRGYKKRVQLGLDPQGVPSDAGIFATQRMIVAHQTFVWKSYLDEAYLASQFNRVSHDIIELEHDRALLAVCSFFQVEGGRGSDGEPIRTSLNVLPVSSELSLAVFTYLREGAPLARGGLNAVLSSSGVYQRYVLSRLILNSCENFVVAPDHYDTWSDQKRAAILDYFTHTLLSNDLAVEDERLYLFEVAASNA